MSDAPVFFAGQTLPAGDAQALGGPITPYTPALQASGTNPTLGTGAIQKGSWSRQGGLVEARVFIQFGTSGAAAGNGTYYVTLPVPFLDVGLDRYVAGSGAIEDSGIDDRLVVPLWLAGDSTTRVRLGVCEGAGFISHSSPWTWGNNDHMSLKLTYPGDF